MIRNLNSFIAASFQSSADTTRLSSAARFSAAEPLGANKGNALEKLLMLSSYSVIKFFDCTHLAIVPVRGLMVASINSKFTLSNSRELNAFLIFSWNSAAVNRLPIVTGRSIPWQNHPGR